MYHHDARAYGAALDETAKKFQAQLDEQIAKTQGSATAVFEKIQAEVPVDRIVHSRALTFALDEDDGQVLLGTKDRRAAGHFMAPLHKHALNQVAARAGVPETYVNRLLERDYGRQLLIENLQTIYEKDTPAKFLVRSVGDQVRGVLSDSFRRMDSRPIIEAFAGACQQVGAVPVEGIGGDLRWAIKAILPMVFRPSTKAGMEELVAYYAQLSNSDFGVGALSMRIGMLRVVCTNYATMDEALRQVHLGKRLGESIEFSQQTYDLDTRTQVSAVKDLVKGLLGPAKIQETNAIIGKALEERVDPKNVWGELLPKLGLLKGEVEQVKEVFNDGGVEMLPAGTTTARVANAISWFAKATPDITPERRLELENIAGTVILGKTSKRAKKDAAEA